VIVSLHFGGPYTPFIGRSLIEQLVGPALRELGAIIVAPDSADGGWTDARAEQDVLGLLAYVEAHYKADPARTLLTGYSMGGIGTWYLASRHPELFEAAIPMAGQPTRESIRIDWETPTLAINSAADELIAIEPVRAVVEALHSRGLPIDLVLIDDVTHFEIPRYRPHLRAAVPWIERAFADAAAKSRSDAIDGLRRTP
jgi:dienelactone hydrolase